MKIATAVKLIFIGVLLVAAGMGLKLVAHATSEEELRRLLVEGAREGIGAELSLESAALGWDAVLRIAGAAIALPGQDEPIVDARQIHVSIAPLAMLSDRAGITKVVVASPTIRLLYDEQENAWNFEALRVTKREEEPPQGLLGEGLHLEGATVVVRYSPLFGDDVERTFSGLYVSIMPAEGETERWQFEGRITDGLLAGTSVQGWFSPQEDTDFDITISCPHLSVGKTFWDHIPYGRDVWEQFEPEGAFGITGRIRPGEGGSVSFALHAEVRDATAKTDFFPARLSEVNGTVEITEDRVLIKDMTAAVPVQEFDAADPEGVPAWIRVNGSSAFDGGDSTYTVEAENLPVCRTSIEAIPDIGTQLWEQLRPSGRCRLQMTLREPAEGTGARFAVNAELKDMTLRPPALPVPVRQVNGTITADNDGVQLRGLRGILPWPDTGEQDPGAPFAHVAADGRLDLDGPDTALTIALRNVRTDEPLVKALPGVGEQIWEMLQPEVVLDADILLGDLRESAEVSPTVSLHIRGGSVHPKDSSVVLTELTGRVKVDGSRVFIEHLLAAPKVAGETAGTGQAAGNVALSGAIDLATEQMDLHVRGQDLVLEEKLFRAAHPMAEQLWDITRLTGIVSVHARITRAGRDEPVSYLLDLALRDAALRLQNVPVPITSVSGQALITQSRIISNGFAGVLCGGRVLGTAVVNYGADIEYPSYAATLDFNLVDLARLIRDVTGEDTEMAGRLTGTAHLGGFLDDINSLRAMGNVSLTEGRLWQNPLIVRLLSVLRLALPAGQEGLMRGEALFTIADSTVRVQEFELLGSGLNATGTGTVGFDEALDMVIVAVGAPEEGKGIPIISGVIGWVVSAVEKQLVRIEVTGTIGEPKLSSQVLSKITAPLTSLRGILSVPLSVVMPKKSDNTG